MKRNNKSIFVCILAVSAFLFCLTCSPAPTAGTATETQNVAGILYQPDGITPAKGAKVYLVKADHNPRQGLSATPDSTVTNDSGIYMLDSVPAGTYNILANGNGNCAYIDSITIKKDTITNVPADTLKAPGGLRGTIKLQPGDDARTVLILFMGTNVWGMPDDSTGKFGLANLAEGKYKVRILTTLDAYVPKDTVLSVAAGKVDTLTKDIVLQYTGIPVVGGVEIEYDTMKQIVRLSWNKVDPTLVNGYYVYRRNVDSNTVLTRINTSPVTDTLYRDSTGIQDQTYEYRVSAIDTNATEGAKSAGVGVKVVGAFVLIDSSTSPAFKYLSQIRRITTGNFIGISYDNQVIKMDSTFNIIRQWGSQGTDTSKFNNPYSLTADKNGFIYVADTKNDRIQKFDSIGKFILMWGSTGSGDGQFRNPQFIEIDKQNRIYVGERIVNRIQVFDSNGVFIRKFGKTGNGNAEFDGISGFGIDRNCFLYIADANNARIQKLDSMGAYLEQWGGISSPVSLFCDNNAILFTEDYGTGRDKVVLFNNDGVSIASAHLTGTLVGSFNNRFLTCVLGDTPKIYIYQYPSIPSN